MKRSLARRNSLATKLAFVVLLALCAVGSTAWRTFACVDEIIAQKTSSIPRPHYDIVAELDFQKRTYAGTARVRWTNVAARATNVVYFHLYPNLRAESPDGEVANLAASVDEPRLEVVEVRKIANGEASDELNFVLEDRGAVLRVGLRTPILAGASEEIWIKFRGSVPEVDAEETGLLAHVLQGVGAALHERREARRARDANYRSRGVMLLGAWFPMLAVRNENGVWQRDAELSLDRVTFAEAADYNVSLQYDTDVHVFTPGASVKEAMEVQRNSNMISVLRGERLRDFPVLLGPDLRFAETNAGSVRVRSVYLPEHERVGRVVLETARESVAVYERHFGKLPYKEITVVGAPLVAGRGSLDFSGMSVVASAFYVDFDAPSARSLPEIVREQRQSLEDSLEWTIAHGVAHQWWGAGAVGSNPVRAPVLDEGLAQWSALLYFRARHGEARAAQALEDQLRGVYAVYRTFGGEDMPADRAAGNYLNSFQYAAIVSGKGALLIEALRKLIGDERAAKAVHEYYTTHELKIAEPEDLRASFTRQATSPDERRAIARTFSRWLSERRGDEDIAPPNRELAEALGISSTGAATALPTDSQRASGNGGATTSENKKDGSRPKNPLRPHTYARIGRFFWKQMTRIR